jgi:hypothetical protein
LAVNKFIQRDLNFKTGPSYLTTGAQYNDERIIKSAQQLCAENFEQLDVKALTKLPLPLFCVVVKSLESFEEDNRELSTFLSEVICRYMEKNPQALSAKVLLELTDELLMPYIASEAAIGMTSLVKTLETEDASMHWDGLVALCRRCAKAVVQEYGWSDFSVSAAVDEYLGNSKLSVQRVSRIDSLLFATSFAAALEQAQDDYEEITVEQENLDQTIDALHTSISLMEEMNLRKDEHMSKQQHAIDGAKQQILQLRQQIDEIRQHQRNASRLPQGGPPPPPRASTVVPQRSFQHTHAVLSDLEKSQQERSEYQSFTEVKGETGNSFTTADIVRDLVSPSTINSVVRGRNLHSREEMRQQSLF